MKPELTDQWVAIQVRSRSENMVETLLGYKGYRTWSPCLPRTLGGGRPARLEPIFPGYIFCQLGEPSQGLVVTTPGVLRFVGPGRRPNPVAPDEIAAIQAVLASGLSARPSPMLPGRAVEVVAGPLKGCCGTVLESKHQGLLLVGISLLQRAVSVVVENGWLRPLQETPKLSTARGNVERRIQPAHALAGQGRRPVLPEWKSPRGAQAAATTG